MVPAQQRGRERRERIVAAAEELIDRYGTASREFSVRRIAELAETSIGTIYHYFPDSNSIIAAVAEQFMEQVLAETGNATAGAETWVEFVERSEAAFLDIFRRRPGLRHLWFDHDAPPAVAEIHRHYHGLLALRCQREIEAATGVRLELALYTVLITMIGSLFELAFRSDPQGDPLVLRELHRVEMTYYLNHLPPEVTKSASLPGLTSPA